ncbi:MAG: phosphopyruvate hydratase [Gemmataceae bacterium]|nr:phosphopyruvate hydratase [Gemmataceae bacterium]
MSGITRIHAREVLDSRGRPTVEAEVTAGGFTGRAAVPSGASTGRHEALELRDGDERRGVTRAVANVKGEIAARLLGMDAADQAGIDRAMIALDGTPGKSRLGANAILAVSLACAHAAAKDVPLWRHLDREGRARLPLPMVNMISGGLHAGGNLDLQDFLYLPVAARSYSEALETACAVYRALGSVLRKHGHEWALVGDEGGYGPRLRDSEQALELLMEACRLAGAEPGIALDVAATHFHREGKYQLNEGGGRVVESGWMVERLERWAKAFPVFSIEDGLAEDDFGGWKDLAARLPQAQLIGDDLFATNAGRVRMGIERGLANAVLVKCNQAGTLTETFDVLALAREAGWRAVVSARSGETEDAWLADLATASGAGQIKVGSVARSERLAKYNRLLRIEEDGTPFKGWGT